MQLIKLTFSYFVVLWQQSHALLPVNIIFNKRSASSLFVGSYCYEEILHSALAPFRMTKAVMPVAWLLLCSVGSY
jgi:hypothetical protein